MADFQKEFLQQVIDTIDDIIFVKDKQGRYILVNKFLADVYHTTVDI
jgi:PAS domain-containing protein